MIALLLAAGQAIASAAAFAPTIDQTYRVVFHQERAQAGATQRFELERRLIFHREAAGLVAEMTLVRVWQDVGGDSGRRFEAAFGALKGRTLRLHLDSAGNVTSIDDEAAIWAATLAGINEVASHGRGRASTTPARDPAALPAQLADERRHAALASPLTSLMARDPEERVAGNGPISVAGGLVAGRSLTGLRSVENGADKRLHVAVHAHGDGPDALATLERERVIDPASGLVIDQTETQTIGAQTVRQRITMTPVS